jgi:RND superfamily putative drug exporter
LLRHKLLVVLTWALVFVLGIMLVGTVTKRMSKDVTLPDQPGYHASAAIASTFGGGGHPTVPVITLPPGMTVDSPGVRAGLTKAFAGVTSDVPARVVSYATGGDRRFVGTDGRTTYGLVYPGDTTNDPDPDATMTTAIKAALPSGTTVQVTGIGLLTNHKGSTSGGAEVLSLTLIGGLGALVVLAFVFGSLLALIPLLLAAVAILATLLLVGVLTLFTDVNVIVEYLVGLIGLGVAIDYSLLLVTRWREELAGGHTGDEAVHRAMTRAGRAVVLSGSTVAVGLLSLVVLPVSFLRSVGYAGMLIPLLSVLVTITLMPVLLAVAGRRLDWPRRRRTAAPAMGSFWTAWARGVVRLRWVAAIVAVAGLAFLGVFALQIQVGEEQSSGLAGSGPAYDGLVALRAAGVPSGVLTPAEVLVPGHDDAAAVAAKLTRLPGVWTAVAPDQPDWRRAGAAVVDVVPAAESGSATGQDTVAQVRGTIAASWPDAQVGGSGAEAADFSQAVYGRFALMVILLSAVTFVLLARAFRSLVLAAKAILVNLLSIGAVLGAIELVWQQGHGAQLLGGVGATGSLDTYVPMFVFAFLFGLSIDYEVFLLTRMRESFDNTGSTDSAVVEGLGRTGRLVTSAALIMFLAFASLAAAQDTVTKIFATGLGVGILLDATVVRSLLVPALVSLMGRWNWWLPTWAARLLRVAPSPRAAIDTERMSPDNPATTTTHA